MSVIERTLGKLRQRPDQRSPRMIPVGSTRRPAGAGGTIEQREPKVFIDREALRASGYMPETGLDRRFADEYRQIKRPLIATAFDPNSETVGSPRLVMMASAVPGDGKTFTSINLALSLARERDLSVVLVDADVAKPHVSNIFGVEREPGLLDALADEAQSVESLVLPTDVPNLFILPAGRQQRETATELLSSQRMMVVVGELLAHDPARIVLFDSSPLLATSESQALSAVVGQVLLVVRAGKTPRQAVLDALALIDEGKAVSLVLNQGRRRLVNDNYYYGEYGTYGQENPGGGS